MNPGNRRSRTIRPLAVAFTVAAISVMQIAGCTSWITSRSGEVTNTDSVAYYLPKRYATVKFIRDKAKGDVPAALEKAKTAEKQALAAQKAANAAVAAANADLEQLRTSGVPADKEPFLSAAGRLATAKTAQAVANTDVVEAKTATQKAQADYDSWLQSDALCGYVDRFSITLLPPVADVQNRFVLDRHHSWFREETLGLKVSKSGLLTTVDSQAEGKTAEAIVALAQAVGAARGSSIGPMMEMPGATQPEDAKRCDKERVKNYFRPIALEAVVDPAEVSANENEVTELEAFVKFASELAFTPEIVQTINDRTTVGKNGGYGVLAIAEVPAMAPAVEQCPPSESDSCARESKSMPGLFYRRDLPVQISFTLDGRPVAGFLLEVPNRSPAEFVAIKGPAFGKVTDKIGFDAGSLTTLDATEGSELLKVARIPIDVLDAVFESISKIIQLRVNIGAQKAELVGKDVAEVSSQVDLTKKQQELLTEEENLRLLKEKLLAVPEEPSDNE